MGTCVVRIQELDGMSKFLPDLWGRFVTCEQIDLREFGRPINVQDLNYGNIRIIKERSGDGRTDACTQLKRMIICAKVGKAMYVERESDVDRGFLRIPPGELKAFLRDPPTSSIYMDDCIAAYARTYSASDCLSLLIDPSAADPQIAVDTEWLARRLSGLADAPAICARPVEEEEAVTVETYSGF